MTKAEQSEFVVQVTLPDKTTIRFGSCLPIIISGTVPHQKLTYMYTRLLIMDTLLVVAITVLLSINSGTTTNISIISAIEITTHNI